MGNAEPDYPLKEYYSNIYSTYDKVNRIFTFGRDVHWRGRAAGECLLSEPENVLDLCTGTGDFLFELASRANYAVCLTGYDFSREMLDEALRKEEALKDRVSIHDIKFLEGNVKDMPFEDQSFDAVGITFGIRNLVYENSNAGIHLSEILRVLRPGGKLVILESSRPDNALWRIFNSIYLQFILPYVGGLISGNIRAYRYLAKSSKNYYSIKQMAGILENAGMSVVKGVPMFLGSVMLVVAAKK
ncbi:MAG TPA: ubiquinone/menaquinone biosynthesis methyltransferase [Bacteroides sp.]|nr:ubiquinone/menaquinone biosynthesis methyltransferase [Bacteroides sp.]